MRWLPMNQENAVTILAGAHEKATIDFKADEYDLSDLDRNDTRFEIAKDIAAFANHLGGTIVVGAVENRATGKLSQFKSVVDKKGLVKAIERACTLCLPVPVATHEQLELDIETQNTLLGRSEATRQVTLVAINVQPYLNGPVGTRVWRENNKKGDSFTDAFRFPCRGVEGTRFLRPEELALVMNSHERRILLQLERLGPDQPLELWMPVQAYPAMTTRTACITHRVDHEGAVIVVKSVPPTAPSECEIPVALVRAVWRTSSGWHMIVAGLIIHRNDGGGWFGFCPSIM